MPATPPVPACPICGAEAPGRFCDRCGAAIGPRTCSDCGAGLSPIAKFCHRCGKAVAAPAAAAAAAVRESRAPWLVAGMLVIAGLTYIAFLGVNRNNPPEVARMPNAGNAAPGAVVAEEEAGDAVPAGKPPDISAMSPAERFNRLYDRVMRAAAGGDSAQVKQFAPMAILAYGMLDTITADLQYHAAVLYAETGQDAAALALADTILAQNPNHLFGYLVRGEVADRRRDAAAAAAARKDFAAHYDAEIGRADRPEYADHKPVIDEYRNGVNSQR